jgi:peroxiredoxin
MARRPLFWTLALLIIILAVPSSWAFRRLEVGDTVDNFALVSFAGGITQLDESMGRRATVVAFWAAWNPRSADALADLQKLYEAYGPDNLRVVAVNVEHEEWPPGAYDEVSTYVKKSGVTFPVVVDTDFTLFDRYGVTVLPSLVVADPAGRVVAQLAGYSPRMRKVFASAVRDAVGAPHPAPGGPDG